MVNEQRRNKREIKYLKKDEWLRLRDSIDNFRDMVIVELLYESGCRVGELAKMDIQDIDFSAGGFLYIPAEHTKTKTARTVYLPESTLSKVKAYLQQTKKKKGPLFNLTKRRVQQLVKKYADRSGVKASAHTLRHSHIVHALLDKVPLSAIQKQVGHKRLTTTQIYSDLAPEQVKEAYERRG